MTFRSAVLVRPNTLEYQETPLRDLRSWECRIRVAWAGICSTDLAIYHGHYPVPLPLVLGHEFCGVVEAVGDSDFSSLIGKTVTAEINNTCFSVQHSEGLCIHCSHGRPHHCSKRTVVGIINHPGAFAEQILVPVRNCHVLPDVLPARLGVMVEPLAAAIQTFEKTPLRQSDTVVVLGAGRLGALIAQVATCTGACVLSFCRSQETAERARRLSIQHVYPCPDICTMTEIIDEITYGKGADIVVEATGNPDFLNLALELVRPEGVIALKSTPGRPTPHFDITRLVVDEITIQGSRCGPFDVAMDHAFRYQKNLNQFIVAEYPFDELPAAIEHAGRGGKVVVKIGG